MTFTLQVSIDCTGDNLVTLTNSLKNDVSKCKTIIFPNAIAISYTSSVVFKLANLVPRGSRPPPEANEEGLGPVGILVHIALFTSLSRRGLGTRIDSRAKARRLREAKRAMGVRMFKGAVR